MSYPHSSHACGVAGRKVVVVGNDAVPGGGETSLKSEIYDIDTNEWREGPWIPNAFFQAYASIVPYK